MNWHSAVGWPRRERGPGTSTRRSPAQATQRHAPRCLHPQHGRGRHVGHEQRRLLQLPRELLEDEEESSLLSTACRCPRRPRPSSRAEAQRQKGERRSPQLVAGTQLADLPHELRESWHRVLATTHRTTWEPFIVSLLSSPLLSLLSSPLLSSPLLYSTLLYSTLLYSTLLYSTLLYSPPSLSVLSFGFRPKIM